MRLNTRVDKIYNNNGGVAVTDRAIRRQIIQVVRIATVIVNVKKVNMSSVDGKFVESLEYSSAETSFSF